MRPQSILLGSITVIGLALPALAQQPIDKQNAAHELEEIYVAHSIRISNTAPPNRILQQRPFQKCGNSRNLLYLVVRTN
jgi:hypothetical protein